MCPISTRRRWIVVLLAAVALLGIGHRPLLQLLARPLVAEEGEADTDFVCLQAAGVTVEGEASFDLAAAWHHHRPTGRLLLLEPWPQRLVEIGVVPSFETVCRRELAKRGVPDAALILIPGKVRDDWQKAQILRAWLRDRPGTEVALVCNRFRSGQTRHIFSKVLGPDDTLRVRIVMSPNPEFDETDWWRTRRGIKGFMYGWLELAFTWCLGENRFVPQRFDAATYEALLQQTFGKPP